MPSWSQESSSLNHVHHYRQPWTELTAEIALCHFQGHYYEVDWCGRLFFLASHTTPQNSTHTTCTRGSPAPLNCSSPCDSRLTTHLAQGQDPLLGPHNTALHHDEVIGHLTVVDKASLSKERTVSSLYQAGPVITPAYRSAQFQDLGHVHIHCNPVSSIAFHWSSFSMQPLVAVGLLLRTAEEADKTAKALLAKLLLVQVSFKVCNIRPIAT